ncbi:MAG: BamA/TamA family outer membrane protein [Gemmatimonadetes bacterium]|nr:BamA/TamA family outer membrane protein [Gemmatimonadota bacterium]
MVLPYPGDNSGFVHVINHELVHVFMFDIAFHSTKDGAARRAFFSIPLWFAEGAAEWFSAGWDQSADMWIRDLTIYDGIVPLQFIYGGFQVYKQGQSAMRYMAATYGDEKVVEFFKAIGRTRNVGQALSQTIGLDVETFSKNWEKSIKQEYWPLYSDKQEPESIGRRLTDHEEAQAYFFQQPSISPDGRYIAFFSDYDGLVDLYLMDAIEGKILRKLVTGYRSNRFLTLHSFESSIGFSPDSEKVTFVAKSGRDEVLYVVRVEDGEILQDIRLDMDIARSPAWSPQGGEVVLSGTRGGQTDLYVVDLNAETVTALTDDIADEHSPSWYPDGERVLYSRYPNTTVDVRFEPDENGLLNLAPVDFAQYGNVVHGESSHDLFVLDTRTGAAEELLATAADDTDPFVVDENTIVFVSNLTGIDNLYTYKIEEGELRRLTDVLGGVFHPSVSKETDRLAFSAFSNRGWDIFLTENFTQFVQENDYPQELETELVSVRMPTKKTFSEPLRAPVAAVRPPDEIRALAHGQEFDPQPADATGFDGAVAHVADTEQAVASGQDGITLASAQSEDPPAVEDPLEVEDPTDPEGTAVTDSLDAAGFDFLEEEKPTIKPRRPIGTVEPYSLRFSLDPVRGGYGGVYYTEGVGLGFANVRSMSDLLGNHRMQFLVNFYGSIKYSDLAASYYYLKRRINYAGGIFHYRNFLNSNFTSLGEVFDRSQLFSERNYGVFGLASLPLTQFDRVDFEVQAFISEKTFYDTDNGFIYFESGTQRDRLIQPSLSYVHDSALYGPSSHGPVSGSRWLVSFSPAIPLSSDDVDRTTTFADYRKYFRLWGRNSLAFRAVGAISAGGTPRQFVVGGPSTLRGWDIFDFERVDSEGNPRFDNLLGRKLFLMNLEYRFPLVDALILGWPGRFGIGGIGGAVFFDTGSAWNDRFRAFNRDDNGNFILQDLNANYGFGIRARVGFIPLKFDWAWKTDFVTSGGDAQYTFSIAPEF